jgi:hypothetical protein
MEGDAEAMKKMVEYNEQDVKLLEEVFLKLRPYFRGAQNIGIYIADDVASCPTCGSENLDWEDGGEYITQVNRYKAFRCKCCGKEKEVIDFPKNASYSLYFKKVCKECSKQQELNPTKQRRL